MLHALDCLDAFGVLCALVLLLAAMRMLEVSHGLELSARTVMSLLIGIGAVWSIARAVQPDHLDPSHVLLLAGNAVWVAHAVYRHWQSPPYHAGRRRTDLDHLDPIASGRKT